MNEHETISFPENAAHYYAYIQSFILCALSFLIDVFFFYHEIESRLIVYSQYHTVLKGIMRLGVHASIYLCIMTALLGLIRSIPKIGAFLQLSIWGIFSTAYHVFYVVMSRHPDAQDLRNLFMTPVDMTAETIFSMLSPAAIIKGIIPVIAVIIFFIIINKALRLKFICEKQPALLNLASHGIAILVFIFFYIKPFHPVINQARWYNALTNSLNTMRQYNSETISLLSISRSFYSANTTPPP